MVRDGGEEGARHGRGGGVGRGRRGGGRACPKAPGGKQRYQPMGDARHRARWEKTDPSCGRCEGAAEHEQERPERSERGQDGWLCRAVKAEPTPPDGVVRRRAFRVCAH